MLFNIQWFSNVFWLIVLIPNILVKYSDDGRIGDWNTSVMKSMWLTHFTYVRLFVLLLEISREYTATERITFNPLQTKREI